MSAHHPAALVISLDFELYWGVRDHVRLEDYKENLLGVRQAVPALLQLFERYGIHATWATVGFLFCRDQQELFSSVPQLLPQYRDATLSPYNSLAQIGANEPADPFHYAPSLIALITKAPFQEIGTHTLSHYYCLEPEQNAAAFRADLEAAQKLAAEWKIELKSMVFPRNQYCDRYLAICHELGILAYRGNESSWMYEGRKRAQESGLRRMLRLMDAYINLTGHNCFSASSHEPCNVPSSRFLRPYSPQLRLLEGLRLKRIVNALDFAARNQQAYHLWWHPHNFGRQLPENLVFLEKILAHFAKLHQSDGMESLNMGEWAARVLLRAPAGASA